MKLLEEIHFTTVIYTKTLIMKSWINKYKAWLKESRDGGCEECGNGGNTGRVCTCNSEEVQKLKRENAELKKGFIEHRNNWLDGLADITRLKKLIIEMSGEYDRFSDDVLEQIEEIKNEEN